MWHNKKDTRVLLKQMNTMFTLLCEMQLCHFSMNTQTPVFARGIHGEIAILYRFFANLASYHMSFAREILNYVPSGQNEFCSWNLMLLNEVPVFSDTRWRPYFKGKLFRKLQNCYLIFFNLIRQIY